MRGQQKTVPAWVILFVLGVAELTCGFESSMIFSAMATAYRVYGDPIGVGWLITSFLLVSAAAAPICARLGDMFGRRRVLMAMLLLSGLGSVVSALSPTLEGVVVGRAIQGVSSAVLPLCFGLLREYLPKDRVPAAVGIIAATAFAGAGLGSVLGGAIVDTMPWQSIFYASSAMSFLSLLLAHLFLPPSHSGNRQVKIDVLGGVLFAPAIALILFAITKGGSWGWGDPRIAAMLGAGALVLAWWVRHELRHADPLIDVRLLANRQILIANGVMGCMAMGAFQITLIMFLLLQQPTWTLVGLGVSATVAGLAKLPSNVVGLFGAPWGGRVAGRRGARQACLYGAVLLLAGWTALTFYHGSVWFIIAISLITQFGMAVVYAAVPNLVMEAAPEHRTSEATGLIQVSRATFGAIGAQLTAFLLATSTIADPAQGPGTFPSQAAFTLTFVAITATCVLGLLLTLMLPRRGGSGVGEKISAGHGLF